MASCLTTISALGATSIGDNAFAGTNGITGIEPNKIKLTYSAEINNTKATDWDTIIDKLLITNAPTLPTIPANGIITPKFVNQLITYEKFLLATDVIWDGVLVANDFSGATSVAHEAFYNNTEITSIILPIEVLSISANAFEGITALTTISALGATSIGNGAFVGTTKITNRGIKLIKSVNITID